MVHDRASAASRSTVRLGLSLTVIGSSSTGQIVLGTL
jgi:hypothetical protein